MKQNGGGIETKRNSKKELLQQQHNRNDPAEKIDKEMDYKYGEKAIISKPNRINGKYNLNTIEGIDTRGKLFIGC